MGKRILCFIIAVSMVCSVITTSNASPALLKVHFLDVGQADTILVQSPDGKTMLIDAGNNGDGDTIIRYLRDQKVRKIDVLVSTHPHEDHEGALDTVINNFSVGILYMNTVFKDNKGRNIEPTTKTHRDVLAAIKSKKLKVTTPKAGTTFKLGKATCAVLSPNRMQYGDLNDFSIVLRLTYNKVSWLFEGDAEAASEQEMISKKYLLKADVLKVSHHGSDTATSDDCLKAISPQYAVISVGQENRFKHPYKATMEKLKTEGIPVYRTDQNETIVCTSDGTNIGFNKEPGDYSPGGDR